MTLERKSYSFDYIVEPEEKISDEKKLVRVYLPLKTYGNIWSNITTWIFK